VSPHPALSRLGHRPWPVPNRRWTWRQAWCDLLFAHWPVPAAALQRLVPPPLEVQEFEGTAWVGVVPFRMEGVARRPLPDLPLISAFPELNVRTYVAHAGRPGVWFLSLDAASRLAVLFARRFFNLPYHHARMSVAQARDEIRYTSVRHDAPRRARFEATYAPVGPGEESRPGSIEHFLTERYCLYARSPQGHLYRTDVHHRPWSVAPARVSIRQNDLLSPHDLQVGMMPALAHFSRRIDVVVWGPECVA
jgi:uncharacterized protein YqjF (DUF2071 family)